SYRRYFSTATAIDPRKNNSARLDNTEITNASERFSATRVATTKKAPATNHFIWRRSSPRDLRNRTTTATRPRANAPTRAPTNSRPRAAPSKAASLNGSDHALVATCIGIAVSRTHATPTNHDTRRHRRESKWPVGNSSKANANAASASTH